VDDTQRLLCASVFAAVRAARLSGVSIRECVTEAVTAAVEPDSPWPSARARDAAAEVCQALNGVLLGDLAR